MPDRSTQRRDAESGIQEWLLSNGLGSYGLGTTLDCPVRPHHVLFTGVLRPPLRRRICVRHIIDEVFGGDYWQPLSNSINPDGKLRKLPGQLSNHFSYQDGLPQFTYKYAGYEIEKSLWMPADDHSVCVTYRIVGAGAPVRIRLKPLVHLPDTFFDIAHADPPLTLFENGYSWQLEAEEQKYLHVSASAAAVVLPVNNWQDLQYAGKLYSHDTCYLPAALSFAVEPEQSVTVRIGLGQPGSFDAAAALEAARERNSRQLVITLDSRDGEPAREISCRTRDFPIRRATSASRNTRLLLAGYPGLAENGWDALLSLPGLLIATGELDAVRQVIDNLKQHALRDQFPDQFFEDITPPLHESSDVTLWLYIIIYEYFTATSDLEYVESIFPYLLRLLDAHISGTENGLQMDETDGFLLTGPESGLSTWMNRKVGAWPVTPRVGKPVEIQALWYNALRIMQHFSKLCGRQTGEEKTGRLADQVADSFRRLFWLEQAGYLADNISELGRDTSFRANQVIALGLPHAPLGIKEMQQVIKKARNLLVTPFGLRSLSPQHPAYCGDAGLSDEASEGAWHNGIVHPWLVWPYTRAALASGLDAMEIYKSFLPLFMSLQTGVLGHVQEAFCGDPPFRAVGVPACARSLGCVVQTLLCLRNHIS